MTLDHKPLCKLEIVEEKGSKSLITFSIQLVTFPLFLRLFPEALCFPFVVQQHFSESQYTALIPGALTVK